MTPRITLWLAVSSEKQIDNISLDEQETRGRAFIQRLNGSLVTVLRWDGYTRWESDIITALDDFAEQGRYEYHQLRDLWRTKAFDILWCYHHSRLGRSFTLQSWVIENVIRSGARIHREIGGWIDSNDYGMQIALGGFSSTTEIERFVALARAAKDAKVANGTLKNPRSVWSHKDVYDDRGKWHGSEPDDSKRLILEDVIRLLLEGVPTNDLERELHARFGHVNPDTGAPFGIGFFYKLFTNPHLYGHVARRWHGANVPNRRRWDTWVFDPTATAPEGVLINYNVRESALAYNPDLEAALQAEMRRRRALVRGSARPYHTRRFSGLLVCATCKYSLVYYHIRYGKPYYRCQTRWVKTRAHLCSGNINIIDERTVQKWFDERIRRALELSDPHVVSGANEDDSGKELINVEARLADIDMQIKRLVARAATADDTLSIYFDAELARLAGELKTVTSRAAGLRARVAEQNANAEQALDVVRANGSLENFWAQEDRVINQVLLGLLGKRRLVIYEKEVKGTILLNK